MRTISKRTGRRYGEGSVLIATMANGEIIPLKFLEGILLDLKGRGYQLNRTPSTITIGSIIRPLEGPLAPLPCASETAFKPCEECQDIDYCGTRIIMRQVRDAIDGVLDKTTLTDLIRQVEAARQEHSLQPLMHHI